MLKQLEAGFPEHLVNLVGRVRAVDGCIPESSIPDGFEVELIVHDGHAPGHTALWLPQQRVLIAGDMLSDEELPLPYDPDNLPLYIDALDLLAPIIDQAKLVIPGHGSVGYNPRDRLDADRRYIDAVMRRRTPADARLRSPGMAEAHESIQRLLREADDRPASSHGD